MLDFISQFVAHNRMLSGGFEIEGKMVTLADITCPVLCFVGEVDEIAPAAGVRAIGQAAPRADIHEVSMQAGHFGLVVGSKAAVTTWPTVAEWAKWHEGEAAEPDGVGPLLESADRNGASGLNPRYGLELTANLAVEAARSTVHLVEQGQRTVRLIAGEAMRELPRLTRLDRARAGTRISIALLLDEQARRNPENVFFLFEGRGHTYAAAKGRIDNIVRGLISLGVRQGEHVGVLMDTRPSALAVVAALNRLGAVVVLLRPGGPTAREVELGEVTRIITDPEHGPEVRDAVSVPVMVLGGGGQPRDLGFGLTDMERIDPDEIDIPAWYTPNPGRAQDLAFILFTGSDEGVRANRITNRRWALSAFGTASAASLSEADTVYGVTPIHHASSVLTSIGGAVAGGARLAMATSFDASTFWEEVRRYGVTIVSYTWTLLRELADAPPNPAERGHPVRLFIGSGMPKGLWRRTLSRFAPAGVLGFYASTEGEAVLVNLSGKKIGAKGRPLPGSADVRVARYDAELGRLEEGPDGFAVECADDEVGMLLSRVDTDHGPVVGNPLRGLFGRNDAWLATGDLFRRDRDGDHWLVDHLPSLIRTGAGAVPSIPIEDALGDVDAVDLAVAYGVPADVEGDEVVVAAVTVREGRELDGDALDAALAQVDPASRPTWVRELDSIPLTTWYRPLKGPLRADGLPTEEHEGVWRLDPDTGSYTSARRSRSPQPV
jgi:putative long chain acyl-CoA synthase